MTATLIVEGIGWRMEMYGWIQLGTFASKKEEARTERQQERKDHRELLQKLHYTVVTVLCIHE